jgi:uncharacterized protein YraI
MNIWKCSMLSASIVALSTGWAAAAPAVVLDLLNLRVGPGYGYGIIEVIPAGLIIDAGACFDGWCQVSVNGIAGYVDANYLVAAQPAAITYGASPSYWPYSRYDGRYTSWTYPYRGYYGAAYDPNYAYYDGYFGSPSPGTFGGAYAYADEPVAGMRVERRPIDRNRPAAVAKRKETPPIHVARPASGAPASSSLTTGAATGAIRPNRADQNPPR